MDSKNRKGIFPPSSSLHGSYLEDIINSNYLSNINTMCSISSYYEKGHATMNNLCAVFMLPIDIDYKFQNKKGKLLDPLDVWKKLKEDIISEYTFFPEPTYIEYGHRLRLIYALESPVILPKFDKEKRKNTIVWLRRIMEEICNAINKLDANYNAEVHKLTSFIRVPGSIHNKYETRYLPGEKKPRFSIGETYIIQVKPVGQCRKWDIHELSDMVLPDLPEWYESYKNRIQKKKKDGPCIHITGTNESLCRMMKRRMDFLCVLQQNGYDEGVREKMCFLFWNFALQSGLNAEEAKVKTIEFNKGLEHPLPERELLRYSFPRKIYKYRMNTVLKELGVPEWLANKYGYSAMDRNTYQKAYMKQYRRYKKIKAYKAGKTKKQMIQKCAAMAKTLKEKGCTLLEIAKELSVSVSSVKRYLVMA